jgi:hypothetical protein
MPEIVLLSQPAVALGPAATSERAHVHSGMDLFLLCIYVLPMERLRALAMELAQIRAARFQSRLMDFWAVDNTHVHGRGAVEVGRLHRTPLALARPPQSGLMGAGRSGVHGI